MGSRENIRPIYEATNFTGLESDIEQQAGRECCESWATGAQERAKLYGGAPRGGSASAYRQTKND
jgi:hypothetical protein